MDEKESELLGQGIKKRSSSETSIKNSIEYEGSPAHASNFSTAKMPKLEIRTPFIFSQETRPRWDGETSGYQSDTTEPPLRTFSFSAIPKSPGVTLHNSPGGEGQSQPTRRSRSSENLLDGGADKEPKSPFSFSLTTPTSLLSSFKFLETKSRTNSSPAAPVKGLRSQSESSSSDVYKSELQQTYSTNSNNIHTNQNLFPSNSSYGNQRSWPGNRLQSGDKTGLEYTPQRLTQPSKLQTSTRASPQPTQNRVGQPNHQQTHNSDKTWPSPTSYASPQPTQNRVGQPNNLQTHNSDKAQQTPTSYVSQGQKENVYVQNQSTRGDDQISFSNKSEGEQLVRSSEERQSFTRKTADNPFLRNSKLRKSIEKILPDSPFIRDSEGRKSLGKSESSSLRNSSAQKNVDKTSVENSHLRDSGRPIGQRSLYQYQERYVGGGVDKAKGNLESEL